MTTSTAPVPSARRDLAPDASTTRLGAAAGLASIALVAAGVALIASAGATFHSPDSEVLRYYTETGLVRTVAGGLVQALGLLLLLPFAAMLAARLTVPGPAGDVLAPTVRMAATVYVTVCLAPGLSAGATALWLARSRTVDPGIVIALNDVRSLSYFLALLVFAGLLVAVGAAGLLSGRLPRWASWSAVGIGVALAASVPTATAGFADVAGLLGLVWVVAVSVSLLRSPALDRQPADEPAV
jgi:hypothetical protein